MLYKDDLYSRKLRDRAYKLADTGRFDGWRKIEHAMIGEGWLNIHAVLGAPYVRLALDDRCATARRGKPH